MKDVPIWEKSNLTLEEAAAYSGIGINKLREITNEDKCKFVLWVGNKRLIKRRLFDCFVEQAYLFERLPKAANVKPSFSHSLRVEIAWLMCYTDTDLIDALFTERSF